MRSLIFSALLVFGAASAQASEGRVVVRCEAFPFTDVLKVELVETDLQGQLFARETLAHGEIRDIYEMINATDVEKGLEVKLSDWNGYTRTLSRTGAGSYTVTVRDECSASHTFISCIEL